MHGGSDMGELASFRSWLEWKLRMLRYDFIVGRTGTGERTDERAGIHLLRVCTCWGERRAGQHLGSGATRRDKGGQAAALASALRVRGRRSVANGPLYVSTWSCKTGRERGRHEKSQRKGKARSLTGFFSPRASPAPAGPLAVGGRRREEGRERLKQISRGLGVKF